MKHIDKLYHFIVGAVIAFFVTALLGVFAGIIAAGVAGYLKEKFDEKDYGLFDVKDFWATLAGGVVGAYAFSLLVQYV